MWGEPVDVGKVVAGATFDAVLDNNGKDLDTVRFVALSLKLILELCRSSIYIVTSFDSHIGPWQIGQRVLE